MVERFEIDRGTWVRGRGGAASALLTGTGKRCCLGFYGAACGLSDEDALNVSLPHEVRLDAKWGRKLFATSTYRVCQAVGESVWDIAAAAINDAKDIDDATRESWVAAFFRYVLGVEVVFVGEYPEVT